MDSGQRGKMPNAKDWTEEINQATDAALGTDLTAEQMAMGVSGEFGGNVAVADTSTITNAQAQALGRGEIFGRSESGVPMNGGFETPEEVAFGRINNTGKASVEAAVELSEIENKIVNPEASVGMVSGAEERDFERRDIETAENEADPGRSREATIMHKSQEAVARSVVPEVEKFLHEKNPEVSGLVGIFRKGNNESLDIVGHPIGEGNS